MRVAAFLDRECLGVIVCLLGALVAAGVLVLSLGCAAEDDGLHPRDCGETATRCDGQ